MVESNAKSIDGLIESFKSLKTTGKGKDDLEKQKRLVTKAFDSLMHKCQRAHPGPSSSTHDENMVCLFEQIELRNQLLKRLQSGLLPSLRHRVTAFSLTLDPKDFQKKDGNIGDKLKSVLDILSELEDSLDQIHESISIIDPILKPSLVDNDQDLKD
ncbi:hypothetical protein KEM48_008261 [Puccinia striiformis f. sp. tritici PST-130]|nr:hypothetical protein KEM48_008261 [Puccinia striiformis f. sp. tritici PST-130]